MQFNFLPWYEWYVGPRFGNERDSFHWMVGFIFFEIVKVRWE